MIIGLRKIFCAILLTNYIERSSNYVIDSRHWKLIMAFFSFYLFSLSLSPLLFYFLKDKRRKYVVVRFDLSVVADAVVHKKEKIERVEERDKRIKRQQGKRKRKTYIYRRKRP